MNPCICLAPLRGVTDAVFRDAYARNFIGIDHAVAPFLTTSKGPRIKPSQLRELLPENNLRMTVTPQILSKSADHFLVLAEALFQLGYRTVNWNLGCPYPDGCQKGPRIRHAAESGCHSGFPGTGGARYVRAFEH